MAKAKNPVVNPHEHESGYETSRPNKVTGAWNVLYKTEDNEAGKWSVLCSIHGTLVSINTKRKAVSMLLNPTDWCSQCRQTQETEEAKKFLTIHTCERPINDQMVMLAQLVRGDPEKCLMFEELHGMKPDAFWD